MSVGKRYVLDANVFIEAHQNYYGFDICPGFWLALIRQHKEGRVCSIDKIRAELVTLKDQLTEWVKKESPTSFFKGTEDKKVFDAFGEMVKWVQNEHQFTPDAKAKFSSVADGWVVAYAKANGLAVVTHEAYAPDVRNNVPIPNVCLEFDVEHCNTFKMLKELKEQFMLKTRRRTQ